MRKPCARLQRLERMSLERQREVDFLNLVSELTSELELTTLLSRVVSEASRLVSDRSVLQLYERWVQTGSRRAAVLLAERGIAPVGPGDGREH